MNLGVKLLLFIFVCLGTFCYYFNISLKNQQSSIEYSKNIEISTNKLIIKSLIMKSSFENYLVTGDNNDLITYHEILTDINNMFQRLTRTINDTNQKNKLYEAKVSLDIWKDKYASEKILLRNKITKSKYTISNIIDEVNKKHGKGYFDVFRQKLGRFIDTEKVLLEIRETKYNALFKTGNKILPKEIKENASWVKHTHDIIINANKLLIYALDMETGMRGYLITGNDDFLEPYNEGYNNLFGMIKTLSKKVSDNPNQVAQLVTINAHMEEWNNNVVKKLINKRREIGDLKSIDWIIKMISSSDGEELFNAYKSQIDTFSSEL